MNYIEIEDAIILHNQIIEEMGGLIGYNQVSLGYLQSALEQIQNDSYYPDFLDKLTHLIFSCVKFHPFLDGNKRTAIYLGIYFLEINDFNGYGVHFSVNLENVVIDLASDKIDKDRLKEILQNIIF